MDFNDKGHPQSSEQPSMQRYYNKNLDLILSKLDKVKRQGSGYTALCPCHDDKARSLSVKEGNDGKILMFCFAACDTGDVLASIGLSYRDLFPDGR